MQKPLPNRWPPFVAAVALAYLVAAVFFPIAGFDFIQGDASVQVVDNPHVRGLSAENVKHIFTSRCISSYYPVRTLTYAINYQFWGPGAASFKVTNGLIHLANVLLVFWLLLRLNQPVAGARPTAPWWEASVAAFCAGVFAVHPVVVEPVAWVPGREELLMTLGALGCFHFHLTARLSPSETRRAILCDVAAGFCCLAACLSNALAVVIPLLITAWDLLSLPRPRLSKIVGATAALWAVAAATVVVKLVGTSWVFAPEQPAAFSAGRLMLVLNVYWLNLRSLVWPKGLTFSYGWLAPQSFFDPGVFLGGVAVALTIAALWILRRRRLVLFGLVWFVIALGPASQIMPHHIHRADRFLYLPLVGLIVAAAAGLRPLGRLLASRAASGGAAAAAVACLFVLILFSARQVQTWRS